MRFPFGLTAKPSRAAHGTPATGRVIDLRPGSKAAQMLDKGRQAKALVTQAAPMLQRAGAALAETALTSGGAALAGAIEGGTGEVYSAGPVPVDAGVASLVLSACVAAGGKAIHLGRVMQGVIAYRVGEASRAKMEEKRLAGELNAAPDPIPVEETELARLQREDADAVKAAETRRARLAELTKAPPVTAAPPPAPSASPAP